MKLLAQQLIFILLFSLNNSQAQSSESSMGRLDPHGAIDQKLTSELTVTQQGCRICHSLQGQKLVTKPFTADLCTNCHNATPHSGVKEHVEKKTENVTCLSCHEVHRSKGKLVNPNSGIFEHLKPSLSTSDLQYRHRPQAMIRKTCVDCHNWGAK